MCAAIATVMVQQGQIDHIQNPEDLPVGKTTNKFYESWVNQIDIIPLLDDKDVRSGKPVASLLDSTIIDTTANEALTPPAAPNPPCYISYVERGIELCSLLRRGVKHIDFAPLEFGTPHDFEESLVNLVRQYADSYYSGLWLNCTSDERLALYQLAKDNWLNPLNRIAISHLWRKKLIVKACPEVNKQDGPYRLMNLSFRAFVLETVSSYELATWNPQQNLSA